MWTFPQLLWIREHCPDVWRRVRHVLFPKDYVRHRLAPGYVTDFIEATGTLFYDPRRRRWIDDMVADLGLPIEVLPRVVEPTAIAGYLSSVGAQATGLVEGTPTVAGTSDTAAEMFGCGAVGVGDGIVKLASVGRLAVVTDHPVWRPGLVTYPHVLNGLWYPGTGAKHAASAYKWLRDAFRSDERQSPDIFGRMDAEAALVAPGSDGLVFLPHLTGAWAPHWDDAREAAFCGIRACHGRAHFTRAVLEGVAFNLKAASRSLDAEGIVATTLRLIGQGAKSQLWREMVAAVIGRPLSVPRQTEAVYGVALLAAIGVGAMSKEEAARLHTTESIELIQPKSEAVRPYEEAFARYEGFEAQLVAR